MQRSRKAFLQRKALEKTISGRNRLYKASLSLVFLLWGTVFLVTLLTSRGDDYTGGWRVPSSCFSDVSEPKNQSSENPVVVAEAAVCGEKPGPADPVKVGPDPGGHSSAEGRYPRGVPLPLTLEEFKGKVYGSRSKSEAVPEEGVRHRVEPGGDGYNYASAAKGAKVLACNRESRGAGNILGRDKDKYLRNPCSAEEKFVVLELSEETLVDMVETANFEHHSSNPRDFEIHGSSTYPTDAWQKLGGFTASNVKHSQRFALASPRWARYLKLVLLTHYGSEFYCTLSVFEVYGVDAVERMLEDWLSVHEEPSLPPPPTPPLRQGEEREEEPAAGPKGPVQQQAGRVPGDTVLKILMQRVRNLDSDLYVLERYLEDLGGKYAGIFSEMDREREEKDKQAAKMEAEINGIFESMKKTAKEMEGLQSWKFLVSGQLNGIIEDNIALRLKVNKLERDEESRENRCIVAGLVLGLVGLVNVAVGVYKHGWGFCSLPPFFYLFFFFLTLFFLFF